MARTHELLFKLEHEDDWPPAAVEGIYGEQRDGSFLALTCPLFVKGLSVGDLIAPQFDDTGEVIGFEVLEPSQHSTVWMIASDQTLREKLLAALRELGCNTVSAPASMRSLCAVDVPGEVGIADVDLVLGSFERAGQISLAYPSFRHGDD